MSKSVGKIDHNKSELSYEKEVIQAVEPFGKKPTL